MKASPIRPYKKANITIKRQRMNKEEQERRKKSPVQIRNKKASFEYFFVDTYTAGIVLTGTEIKSIRAGKASLTDSFCYITRGEMWVEGMNISPYFYGSYANHEARRTRKLLLNRRRSSDWRHRSRRQATRSFPYWSLSTSTDAPRWTSPSHAVRRCTTSVRPSKRRRTDGR